jgi:hypothetical protein
MLQGYTLTRVSCTAVADSTSAPPSTLARYDPRHSGRGHTIDPFHVSLLCFTLWTEQ